MFKVMMFSRRRADLSKLSFDEYVAFYENKRVPFAAQLAKEGKIVRHLAHRRNYVLRDEETNLTLPRTMRHFDLVTEGVYPDRQSWEASMLATRETARKALYEDPTQPFDLDSRRYMFVDERVGDIVVADKKPDKPFKVFMFARRRPDLETLTYDAYIELIETQHVPLMRRLIEKEGLPPLIDYRRNYVRNNEPANLNLKDAMDFDVVLEEIYRDRETYDAFVRKSEEVLRAPVCEDGAQPFDLSSRCHMFVEERMGGLGMTTAK